MQRVSKYYLAQAGFQREEHAHINENSPEIETPS